MPIAHISLPVADLGDSERFYTYTLEVLGYKPFMCIDDKVFGFAPKYSGPDFWFHVSGAMAEREEVKSAAGVSRGMPETGFHVAFQAGSKRQVREWYKIGMSLGGRCNGQPGERPQYTKGYYAAYLLDQDGHNVECVYYQPLWLSALQWAPRLVGVAAVAGVAWWGGHAGWGL